ncbi:MAG: methyltransferase family protein [Candidatus Saganbacteria bacterium]|uniref:Methyltransferase family protein n=1 Tax=Candidatus Saganbacteria bacterium TaxID=2575572 RepID=A0A833NSU3_UNCSA|nr:MAG: methyltransferase family protein [Candidatus Saganbacteria bacterium]
MKDKQIQYYESLFKQHGDHYLSLDWKSPESQGIRYRVFEDLINMVDKKSDLSVLDVGCGLGHLYDYLKKAGYNLKYTGYDISPKLIEAAKNKFPSARFEVKDILADKSPGRFDFIFCCGALNISFEEKSHHLEFIRSMLLRMFELCNIAVGANFLSSQAVYHLPDDSFREPQYFYSKPEEIVSFAKGMSNRFILRHDYHPGDFTIYIIK